MSVTTAELDARLELLEEAFFGDEESSQEGCGCEFCSPSDYPDPDGLSITEVPIGGLVSAAFTEVVLDGAEGAIIRLTEIAESGSEKEALEASNLLLQYGLALVDRGRV